MKKGTRRPPLFVKDKRAGSSRRTAYAGIARISDQKVRNLIRGAIAGAGEASPSPDTINAIRRVATPRNLAISMQILFGRAGAFPFSNTGGTYRGLLRQHSLNVVPIRSEIAFVAGHLNGWKEDVLTIIEAMTEFAQLPTAPASDAMEALAVFVERFGASSYCVRKVAYLMSRYPDVSSLQNSSQRIAERLEQSKFPSPFFSAMELLDDDVAYFETVSTRVQIYQKFVTNDFRQYLSLHDLVPVPLSESDLAAHLRKSHSTSIVDELVSLVCILNFRSTWPDLSDYLKETLDEQILAALEAFSSTQFDASALYSDCDPLWADLRYYRQCFAFTEFAVCAQFRAFVDAIVAPRLMTRHSPAVDQILKHDAAFTVRDLTKALHGFHKPTDYLNPQRCGTFLRTVQFLIVLEKAKGHINIPQHELRLLFERTIALDILLSGDEIERLYASTDDESRPLVTVLALALHKARSRDEDVDFKFRHALCQTVQSKFRGRLENFIEWLLERTPQIATYLLHILDRQTLQKLYWLIRSADEADTTRQALLRAVGKKRGQIAYFLEADAIEAQRQVAKLRKYFDDSRVYVDGIAMREWLVANPSAYAQQYPVQSPFVSIAKNHAETILKIAQQFGFTPASRGRAWMVAAEPEAGMLELDALDLAKL